MSQLLALEWNGSEARAAVATKRGDQIVIEQAFRVPVQAATGEAGQSEPDIGEQITKALGDRGIGQIDVLVAAGRGSVELRQLQLPAATDDELPKMVRLRAMVEFNEFDENWLLDFVPVDEPEKGSCTVLAAAIAPELIERIQEVCQRSNLKMRRLALRSCAAVSLWARAPNAQRGQVELLVELLADRADLTATIDGRVLFLRTMRLSEDPPSPQSLLAELRLTMAAVQNQFGGRKVTRIVICGLGDAHASLARQIEKETETPTVLFDPFAGLELGHQLRRSPPEYPGRFAAVLGMLSAELNQTGHAIDFLHPRHAVEPPAPRKIWKWALAVAAAMALMYVSYSRIAYLWLAGEVKLLETQSAAIDQKLAASKEILASTGEISKWMDGNIVWIDQLRDLSEDFPPAKDATVGRLTFVPATIGKETRWQVQLEGAARNVEAIAAMEQKLRERSRRVVGGDSHEDRAGGNYSWQFKTTVFVGQGAKP